VLVVAALGITALELAAEVPLALVLVLVVVTGSISTQPDALRR
jgi:hypothetical protein